MKTGYQLVTIDGNPKADTERIRALLELAYAQRACFICEVNTNCRHREPTIELAIAAWRGIGATLEDE